jgi:TolB-like protein
MKKLFCILSALFLTACTFKNTPSSAIDVPVEKGKPMVYIYPLTDVSKGQKVGILPFIVPGNMAAENGRGVAALFKDILLKKRVFLAVKQLDKFYGNIDEALNIGKESQVDLVLAGQVHYAIAGTELGGARVDVSVRLVSVNTGNTIWYIEQSVDQPMDYPDVRFITRLMDSFSPSQIRKSQGAPAVPNMLVGIAGDIAGVMAGVEYISEL